MNRTRTSILVVLTGLLALAVAFPARRVDSRAPQAGKDKALPAEVVKILDGAEQLELYSLDPANSPKKDEPTFRRWKVLGKTTIKDAARRKDALAALYKSVEEGDKIAKCFEPRHAFHAEKGGEAVDVVICFECYQLYLYRGDKEGKMVPISRSANGPLDKLLRDAGVPLAKPLDGSGE